MSFQGSRFHSLRLHEIVEELEKDDDGPLPDSISQISWVVSLATVGALPGCWLAQVMAEKVGRRRTIYMSAVPGLIGAGIIALAKIPELLYVARICQGISTGMIAVVTMIYITEIASKEIRGSLGMLVQVMNNFGSLLMYGAGPFISYTALNFIVLSVPIAYVLFCLWLPESPYYHLKDGRFNAARKEYMFLNGIKDEQCASDELVVMQTHVKESMESKSTFTELVTNKRYRKALYVIAGLKVLQYMTGALAIQSYLEIIIRQSSSMSGPHASIIYGFVQLCTGILATFITRYFGRRILLLISSFGVGASLTALGIYFYLKDQVNVTPETLSHLSYLPVIGILGFNILYTIGIGNIPYVMQAELFPINVKAVASSAATMSACIFSFAVAKGYQGIKDAFGHYTVFWSFAFVAFLGVFFVYFVVPETRGKSLEQVQEDMRENNEEAIRLQAETNETTK